jgi:hypothetical protein
MARLVSVALVVVLVAACSDPAAKPDAAIDARADAAIDAADAGPCGVDSYFTGEYVDWDSTDTSFHGIFDAQWQVHGDPTRTKNTNPNGRFELCVAAAAGPVRVDVTPKSTDTYLPGIAIARADAIAAGVLWTTRSFRLARGTAFLQGFGVVYDPTKAQVLVHVDGTPRAVSLTASHATTLAYARATTTWAAGDAGYYVYFPNVDPTAGTTTIAVAGGAIGAGDVPLLAGTFSYAAVIAN